MGHKLLVKQEQEDFAWKTKLKYDELVYETDTGKIYTVTLNKVWELEGYGRWLIENNLSGSGVKGFIKEMRELAKTNKDETINILIKKFEQLCIDIKEY